MGYRDYSTAKGHIVDATGHGDFTTIGAALAAASSGQTIFIRPGTYTENLTLVPDVDLVAFDANAISFNVTINGEVTASVAGNYVITGICFQTNSNYALSVTGSGDIDLTLNNCYINCTNNTGINYTNSNGASSIFILNSIWVLGTTGIAYYSSSSAGELGIQNCLLENASSSTAASNSAGNVFLEFCVVSGNLSTSSTGMLHITNCSIQAFGNTTALTFNGSANSFMQYSYAVSGSAVGISIGSGATLNMWHSSVNSTNTNAIGGSGTLNKGSIVFTGASSTIQGTLTVNTYTTA